MKYLLLLFCLLPVGQAFSQEGNAPLIIENGKHFFGGITLGLNTTQVDGDAFSGFHSAGLNAGGMVYWFFTKDVGASMEFLFSQKGSHGVEESYSPYAGAYFAKYKMRLNYIEVPVCFHYLFDRKYMIGFGGSFNALLSSKESMEDMGSPVYFDPDQYPFNKTTFDLMGGISMFIWKNLIAEARYQYGITPLRNQNNVAPFVPGMGASNQYDNMLAFRLIYLFQ